MVGEVAAGETESTLVATPSSILLFKEGLLPGLRGTKLDLLPLIGLIVTGEVEGLLLNKPILALTLSPTVIVFSTSVIGLLPEASDGP